ncbi:unnamed protein product [Phytomonas sp. Hart1]|nr:unnamed protein product [Phytomonas sp. Hart1]|eukprot:CCW67086.1 unnamed protein product [Phytomonas sp. isolate Hart1]
MPNTADSAGPTPEPVNIYSKMSYIEVIISFVSSLGLLIFTAIQLFYRTADRQNQLLRVHRQTHFDGMPFLSKPKTDCRRKIVENGLNEHKNRIVNPPQCGRIIPAVVENLRDAKQDCAEMLQKIRSVLQRSHGKCAELMSMRCCLSCVKGVLPENQSERFLRVYELVSFGVNRVNGMEKYLISEDIKFLHFFFYDTILKELQ